MDGVDAHHLVVDIALETIQASECRWFRSVACQTSKRHGRTVQRPFHDLHLDLNHVVAVDERLLPHSFELAGGPEQLAAVEVLDLDVRVINAVLAQKHGHARVRCVQGVVREQHLVGPTPNEQAVVVHESDLSPLAIRPRSRELRPPDLKTAFVGHAREDIVEANTSCARFESRIRPPREVVLSLHLQTQHPFQRKVKKGAPKSGFFRGERTAFHADLESPQLRRQIAFVGGAFPFHAAFAPVKSAFQHLELAFHLADPSTVAFGKTYQSPAFAFDHGLARRIEAQNQVALTHKPRGGTGRKKHALLEELL